MATSELLTRDQILRKLVVKEYKDIMTTAMDASLLPVELMMIIFENCLPGRQLALEHERLGNMSEALKEHIGVAEEFKLKLIEDGKEEKYDDLTLHPSTKSMSIVAKGNVADSLFKAAIGYYHGMNVVLVDEKKAETFAVLAEFLDRRGMISAKNSLFSNQGLTCTSVNINGIFCQYRIDESNMHNYIPLSTRLGAFLPPITDEKVSVVKKKIEERLLKVDMDKVSSVRVQYNLANACGDLLPSPVFQDIFMNLVHDVIRQGASHIGLDLLLHKLNRVNVDGSNHLDFFSAFDYGLKIFDDIKKQYSDNSDEKSGRPKIELLILKFHIFLKKLVPSSFEKREEVKKICDWCFEFALKKNCYEAKEYEFEQKLAQGLGSLDNMFQDFINFVETNDDEITKSKGTIKLYQEYRSPGIVDGKQVRMRDAKKALYWHSHHHNSDYMQREINKTRR